MQTTYVKTNFTKLTFNRTIDFCAYANKKRSSDWFFRIVFETMAASGKSIRQCPVQKGTSILINKFYIKPNVIPSFLSIQDSNVVVYFNWWTKIKKDYLSVVAVKVLGQFQN